MNNENDPIVRRLARLAEKMEKRKEARQRQVFHPLPSAGDASSIATTPQIDILPPTPQFNKPPPSTQVNKPPPTLQVSKAPPTLQVSKALPTPQVSKASPTPQVSKAPPTPQVSRAPPTPQSNKLVTVRTKPSSEKILVIKGITYTIYDQLGKGGSSKVGF